MPYYDPVFLTASNIIESSTSGLRYKDLFWFQPLFNDMSISIWTYR